MIRGRSVSLAGVAALSLALAGGLQPSPERQDSTLSVVDRLYGLSVLWQEANYNFAFFDKVPDLDWDQTYREFIPQVLHAEDLLDYYRTLQRFTALLGDGHTRVDLPRDVVQQN